MLISSIGQQRDQQWWLGDEKEHGLQWVLPNLWSYFVSDFKEFLTVWVLFLMRMVPSIANELYLYVVFRCYVNDISSHFNLKFKGCVWVSNNKINGYKLKMIKLQWLQITIPSNFFYNLKKYNHLGLTKRQKWKLDFEKN